MLLKRENYADVPVKLNKFSKPSRRSSQAPRGRAGVAKRVALRRQWLSAYAGSNPVVRIHRSFRWYLQRPTGFYEDFRENIDVWA